MRLETQYREQVAPLLARYCVQCHGPDREGDGLDVSAYPDAASVAADIKTWEQIREYVEFGDMPPFDQPQPSAEEAETIAHWIEAYLTSAACTGPVDPGRVTLRRLNRAEYNNTIRDLIGVDFRPADDFPTDDVGYGFDNIGDVLTLSPILLEKYLNAAESIADLAIVVADPLGPLASWSHERFQGDGSSSGEGARILPSNGAVHVDHQFPGAGEYVLRVRAYAQQAGDEPARMAIRLGEDVVAEVEVKAEADAPEIYEVRVPIEPGPREVSAAFLNDFYDPEAADPRRRDRNLLVESIEVQGPIGQFGSTGETRSWNPARIESEVARPYDTTAALLHSNGELAVTHEVKQSGLYVFRVRAFGERAGDELPQLELRTDGQTVATSEVEPVEADEAQVYEARIELSPGERRLAVAFDNDHADYGKDGRGDTVVQRDRNLVILGMELQGPILDGDDALPESHRRIVVRVPEDETDADQVRACAREVMERFASRAYRRPATEDEVAALVRFVELGMESGGGFAEGVRLAVTASLVSPHFLFRVELDPGSGNEAPAVRPLDGFELASRLSYFLWSSMPDEELLRLARDGVLGHDDVLEGQVRRMLGDPKVADGLVENFSAQWLQLRGLASIAVDKALFPDFDDALRDDMLAETKLYFREILTEDRSILEFLDSDWTILNERLARHYGIEGVDGAQFRKVELSEASGRGGLLTQASVLAATSNPTRTSPVKRGKWVLEVILGTPPPPPPPDVPELSEDQGAILSGSLRERLERHRADPNCAVCHDKLDPLGFVMENFDPVGAWREKDGAFRIDPSGSLPSGETFDGPDDLKFLLKEMRADQFTRAFVEKMTTYALGRGLESTDQCVVDQVELSVSEQRHRFSSVVVGIALSPTFRMTKTVHGSER